MKIPPLRYYEEVCDYIANHPGVTPGELHEALPWVTHYYNLLSLFLIEGKGFRVRTKKRGYTFSYYPKGYHVEKEK